MKRIATANRAVDLFGVGKDGFRAAVPGVSDATYLAALQFNHMQEAIVRTIEQAGLALSDTDFDQFVTALNTIYPRLSSAAFTASPTALTPPQFDATTKLATTEFIRKAGTAYSGIFTVSDAYALTAANCTGFVYLGGGTNGKTVVLPAVSSMVVGQRVTLMSPQVAGSITITRGNVNDTINGIAAGGLSVTDFTMGRGDTVTLVAGVAGWYAEGGALALVAASQFASSLAGSGYQKLPGGWILQWGNGTTSDGTGLSTVVFPIPFPSSALHVSPFYEGSGSTAGATPSVVNAGATTLIGCKIFTWNGTNISGGITPTYIAIGK